MKNEALRSSLEKSDRKVHEQLKNLAPLFSAVNAAVDAYRAAGCMEAAAAYEAVTKAIFAVEDRVVDADMVAVMTHKHLAGVGVPVTAKQDEIPAFMVGQQMEMD